MQKMGKNLLRSPNKKVYLQRRQIFSVIKQYNLILFPNDMIHFKDIFLCISHHAICNRFELDTLSITEKYVVK